MGVGTGEGWNGPGVRMKLGHKWQIENATMGAASLLIKYI